MKNDVIENKKIKSIILYFIITVLITSIIVVGSLMKKLPDVVGMDEASAVEILEESGFKIKVEYIYDSTYDKGNVITLASSFNFRSNSSYSFSTTGLLNRYNCKKILYVLVSKGPSGYISDMWDSSIEGMHGSYRFGVYLFAIDYDDYYKENSYFRIYIDTYVHNSYSFNDFDSAIFSSDITQDINCNYTHELNDDGSHYFCFDFPIEQFGELLPSYFKYTFVGKNYGSNNELIVLVNDIVWEKR